MWYSRINNTFDLHKNYLKYRYIIDKIKNKNNSIIYLITNGIYTFGDLLNLSNKYDIFKFSPAITNNCMNETTLVLNHDGGFFSACTMKLQDIIVYFNKYKKLPKNIISNKLFGHYKSNPNEDVTSLFFDKDTKDTGDTKDTRDAKIPEIQELRRCTRYRRYKRYRRYNLYQNYKFN